MALLHIKVALARKLTCREPGACGIFADVLKVSYSSVIGCELFGLSGESVRVKNTVATGSGLVCTPGTQCGDIVATKNPRLKGVTCETSSNDAGENWGVCSLD
jgi:hypothetical protein